MRSLRRADLWRVVAPGVMALFFGCAQHKSGPTLTSGNASVQLSTDGRTLTFARGGQTLLTFGTDGFELGTANDLTTGSPSFDPWWLNQSSAEQPTGLAWLQSTSAMKLVGLTSTQLTIQVNYTDATVTVVFTAAAPNRFAAHMSAQLTNGQAIGFMRLRPNASPTEAFYGLGEWGDTVNHRGKIRAMQMELGPLESSDTEDHVPVPLLIGTRGWGLFVQSKRPGQFDVASQNSTLVDIIYGTAEQSAEGLDFHLFSEPQPLDIPKHYFDVTGYPRLPAPWALGPLIWRNHMETQDRVMTDINTIRTLPLATTGVWFDDPYATGINTWDFNPAQFPDAPAMFQALHDNGLRFGLWQVPYEAASGGDAAPVQSAYAVSHGFFPPVSSVLTNQWSKPIDFTNQAAYDWWATQLQIYATAGVEGFKNDYGEDVNVGFDGAQDPWKFSDGSTELTMHYGYTLLYHQVYSAALPAEGGWLLDRTGRWGDQVHGMIIWPGDLDADMSSQGDLRSDGTLAVGGLPAAIIKGIGLSASGFLFYSSDTGGYRHAPCDNETYIRWLEASALGTAMETGDASSQTPWEYAANGRTVDSLNQYQRYASLHLRLYPYQWTYAKQIATTGRPIERAFGLAYPAVGQNPSDEYLLGDSMLVAPIVAHSPDGPDSAPPPMSRTVFLPPGKWLGWWQGEPHDGGTQGGQFTETADIDTLPLYIAAGGIVPMLRDTIQTLSPVAAASTVDSFATSAGVLWIRVAPGPAKTSLTLYDGATVAQQPGSAFPTLSFTPGSTSPVFTQGALFELIATQQPTTVSNQGAALSQQASLTALETADAGWFWESSTAGTLWIKVPGAANLTIH